MIVTTTDSIEGYEITEYLGIVIDKEICPITGMLQDSYFVKKAVTRGADAIVGVAISSTTSDVSDYDASPYSYCYLVIGTAVKIRKK